MQVWDNNITRHSILRDMKTLNRSMWKKTWKCQKKAQKSKTFAGKSLTVVEPPRIETDILFYNVEDGDIIEKVELVKILAHIGAKAN